VNHRKKKYVDEEDIEFYDFEDIAGMISLVSSRIFKDYTVTKDLTPYNISEM
jgi:hypothetical protein